jgi:hypothetical protein
MNLLWIGAIAAIIAAVIILVFLFPAINMLFCRLLFGRYSARYVKTVRKYTGKSPYPYCIKDDFINHIAGFFKQSEHLKHFETEKSISFKNADFGLKFRAFLRKNSTPFCINSIRLDLFDLKVLGYRDTLFSLEMKKYFFFINGIFILGQITFKNPKPENVEEITAIIGKKYLNSVNALPYDNYRISDKQGNSLFCENNGFHLSLSYLSGNHEDSVRLLEAYWENATVIKLKKTPSLQKELMDKL